MSYTRLQIVRILKERGWTKKRTLWVASNGMKRTLWHAKSGIGAQGVSLREAASLEMLASSENLDSRRAK